MSRLLSLLRLLIGCRLNFVPLRPPSLHSVAKRRSKRSKMAPAARHPIIPPPLPSPSPDWLRLHFVPLRPPSLHSVAKRRSKRSKMAPAARHPIIPPPLPSPSPDWLRLNFVPLRPPSFNSVAKRRRKRPKWRRLPVILSSRLLSLLRLLIGCGSTLSLFGRRPSIPLQNGGGCPSPPYPSSFPLPWLLIGCGLNFVPLRPPSLNSVAKRRRKRSKMAPAARHPIIPPPLPSPSPDWLPAQLCPSSAAVPQLRC
ncbi:Hypothetical predicted protein [Podarcis lilfordi]|uniref:Uncharacterized protein n=1 Tax=Podarcis lilfordi TaxID=74358 RepID=A0AA35LE00_9SAUR|nr:Hypothetical predicted protein [Podarcis lilfordi]